MNSTISKRNVTVIESLSIVTIEGFEPEATELEDGSTWANADVDPEGSANHFHSVCQGIKPEENRIEILGTDYDFQGHEFAFLIDSVKLDQLAEIAEEAGYTIVSDRKIDEPCEFGDGGGTVEILKHRDGWVVLG